MTDTTPARAAADAAFRPAVVAPEEKQAGMDEYRARQQAALDNMARLRAMRMASKAKTGTNLTVVDKRGHAGASAPKTQKPHYI